MELRWGVVVLDFVLTDGACEAGAALVKGAEDAGALGATAGPVETGADTVGHDSDSDRIGKLTGNDNDDSGVPGGTSTVNGIFTPPSNVTVTTHCSADADGSAATPRPANMAPAAATPPITLRLLNTFANLLPCNGLRKSSALRTGSAARTLYDWRRGLQRGRIGVGCSSSLLGPDAGGRARRAWAGGPRCGPLRTLHRRGDLNTVIVRPPHRRLQAAPARDVTIHDTQAKTEGDGSEAGRG